MSQLAVPPNVFPPEIEAALDAALTHVAAFLGPAPGMAIGWATVDLERAAAEQAGDASAATSATAATTAKATAAPAATAPAPDDLLLGARCRLLTPSAGGMEVVLLEPSTEGRLAASLARFGEGPVVLYLRIPTRSLARLRVVAPASGVHCSRPAPGPFGSSVLLLDGPPSGPHLVVTEAAAAGTIGR